MAFVKFTAELALLVEQSLVVTPNERLCRELVNAYDQYQLDQSQQAWPTPSVKSLGRFLGDCYQQCRLLQPELPRVLGDEELLVLTRDCAAPGLNNLASQAMDAWNTCATWNISPQDPGFQTSQNGRNFSQWALRIEQALTTSSGVSAISKSQLPGTITKALYGPNVLTPQKLTFLEFDQISAAVRGLLTALAELGWDWREAKIPQRKDQQRDETPHLNAHQCAFTTAQDEANAAAQWCAQMLAEDPDSQIAVVVPDLSTRYQAIDRQFAAVLAPIDHDSPVSFEISAGQPLSETPIWQAGQSMLTWLVSSLSHLQIHQLTLLPVFAELFAQADRNWKIVGDTTLTEYAKHQYNFAAADQPKAIWQPLHDAVSQMPATATLSVWANYFSKILTLCGWRSSTLGSKGFQAHAQADELLSRLGKLGVENSTQSISGQRALDSINACMTQRLFATERADSQIQILGYLETTGLSFTHLWVTGMHAGQWPSAITGSPFIPFALLRAARVPRIDQNSELLFAEQQTRHWLGCSDQVVFSYPKEDGDAPCSASALIAHLPIRQPNELLDSFNERMHPYLAARADTQTSEVALVDMPSTQGSQLDAQAINGGSGLLKTQAQCPFRAWAIHRLGLTNEQENLEFPSSIERGNLAHLALELLAQAFPNSTAIEHIGTEDMKAIATRAVTSTYHTYPRPLQEAEISRIQELLTTWVAMEKNRDHYVVEATEATQKSQIAGVELTLRADRIDRVEQGRLVIDYKTGNTEPKRLVEESLLEPQLPLYAGTQDELAGVLLAEVRTKSAKLAGPTATKMKGIRTVTGEPSWAELQHQWQTKLESLMREYLQGHAAITPANANVCTFCHLDNFCRIKQVLQEDD